MLSFVVNKHPYPTSDVTTCAESATYILHIFANSLLKEIAYHSKRPTTLFFTILLPTTIKNFI